MPGHCSRSATAPEIEQVMMQGSSKRLMRFLSTLLRSPKGRYGTALGRTLDQLSKASLPRVGALRAEDPVARRAPVAGRPGLPVVPSRRVGAQALLVLGRQLRRRLLLERVDAGPVLRACLEGAQAGRAHQALLPELRDLLDVDPAPVAPRLPRREALHVALGVDRVGAPVDPAEAERLVDRLRPGEARPSGALLPVAHVHLRIRVVVTL